MTTYDSTADTLEHIGKVQARIEQVRSELAIRAAYHDQSKLAAPEKPALDAIGPPNAVTYSRDGVITSEYQAMLVQLTPMLAHHYANNTHHPQHFLNGINGFSLLDLMEWFCDIKAAGERYKNGNLRDSLEANKARFGIDDQLYAILCNTVEALGW